MYTKVHTLSRGVNYKRLHRCFGDKTARNDSKVTT